MYKVDLYMENAGKSPKEQEGGYGYIIAYKGKMLYTVDGFGSYTGSRNRRDVYIFLQALKRCKECEMTVHTDSNYLKGGFKRIEQYEKNGWMKPDGNPVKNADLWKEVATESRGKEISFQTGQHEYTEWLKMEIRRRKNV